jgi:hypothetical protein
MSRTLFQTTTTDATFEAIISAWDKSLPCEVTTRRGSRCQRAASKRVNIHGCRHRLMCSQHAHDYLRDTVAAFRQSSLRCAYCCKRMGSISEAVEVNSL